MKEDGSAPRFSSDHQLTLSVKSQVKQLERKPIFNCYKITKGRCDADRRTSFWLRRRDIFLYTARKDQNATHPFPSPTANYTHGTPPLNYPSMMTSRDQRESSLPWPMERLVIWKTFNTTGGLTLAASKLETM